MNSALPNRAITAALTRESAARRFDELPGDVVMLAQQCLLDWFGVALLGSREPLANILVDEASERGSVATIPLIGRHEKLGLLDAALVNGAAAHALDYDDGNRAGGHLSASAAAAALALAYQLDASGQDLISAFVAGYELSARVGHLIQPNHYARGFHPTATLGTFGAAAAAAHLLKLNAAQTDIALGIAASQAAGLVGNFGTMCKPMHVGRAAMNGLQSARLAQRGFTAREGLLEHPSGFAAAHSGDFSIDAALATPNGGFFIRANVFKFHAACAGTHSTIDTANALRIEHAIHADAVDSVTVHMSPRLERVCNVAAPTTGLEVKFSLRMTTALALAGIDTSDPAIFTDELAHTTDLVKLRDRVTVVTSARLAPMATIVDIRLRDGRHFSAEREGDMPDANIRTQGERVRNKFQRLARSTLGTQRADQLAHDIDNLAQLSSVRALLDCAIPG